MGGTYTYIIRQATHMTIRRFTLTLVQALGATYSIVAKGKKTRGGGEAYMMSSGSLSQQYIRDAPCRRRGNSDPAHHQSPHYHNTHQGTT
jgi:chaperonin GroEL (HSP60 family)